MPGKAVGWAAVELPWLCPNTDSLIALAEAPARVVELSAFDPALALFLLRFTQPAQTGFTVATLTSSVLPETAAVYLAHSPSGVLNPECPCLRQVLEVGNRASVIATALAETTGLVPAFAAATTARLAPLGWFAVAAIAPSTFSDLLTDPQRRPELATLQTELWGVDHASISRRLVNRWRLPEWLGSVLSALSLPLGAAITLGVQADLFAIVQLAVLEAEQQTTTLGLAPCADRGELLQHLGVAESALHEITSRPSEPVSRPTPGFDPNPHRVPLVGHLLRMAAASRRRNGASLVARLEAQLDTVHQGLALLGDRNGARVQEAKLDGLAELAAGAAHEINNPLAVISGNAQRLLRTEPDTDRGEALRAVVRQANRIAGIVRDLMRFARPPAPNPRTFPLIELVQGVLTELAPSAAEHEVRLDASIPDDIHLHADQGQLGEALAAVVRNGIQAAGQGGWVQVSSAILGAAEVALRVEDSGPGLDPNAEQHAFDPFFCGRTAGRGRGLGLPTAWQLARQNGGGLQLDSVPGEPTRFVLTARRALPSERLALHTA